MRRQPLILTCRRCSELAMLLIVDGEVDASMSALVMSAVVGRVFHRHKGGRLTNRKGVEGVFPLRKEAIETE